MEKEKYSHKDFTVSTLKINAIDRIHEFQKYIDQLSANDHEIYWIETRSGLSSEVQVFDKKKNFVENKISFVSNDYLGMSQHEKTVKAGIKALKKYGTGVCAAPCIGGFLDIHKKLENELAEFLGFESAMIFSTGYGANSGTLSALLGKEDLAIIDTGVHSSVLDGLRSTNVKPFPHNHLENLEFLLKREMDNYKTIMVIIDGVYSQDGDIGFVKEINLLCRKYKAILLVDDAHGIGVLGENGKGTLEAQKMLGDVDILTGTFSKSFGAIGGFVASSKKMIQYLKYYANTSIFSAAITPQATCSILEALNIIKTESSIREQLWINTNYLKEQLKSEGFDIGKSESPIIPLMVRNDYKVKEITRMLWKEGLYTIGIVYPAVRSKEARIRLTVTATHTQEQIDKLVASLIRIRNILHF